ncbi:hypothetical protein BDZ94DRAFT_1263454 [Collybia nuda]|uniref:Uncharacterized protein n=1 Tax=Collybia nuda TaxID=64659 RepID=A0A9P6CGQ3_9AGAR|nr:hypothetical protein BDZ94DRAFT_1263454 [Collybia nuda]
MAQCKDLQIWLLFQIVCLDTSSPLRGADTFLAYIQYFDLVPQINQKVSGLLSRKDPDPDPASGMFILKCAHRNN